jgi:hypothetical protein
MDKPSMLQAVYRLPGGKLRRRETLTRAEMLAVVARLRERATEYRVRADDLERWFLTKHLPPAR